MRRLSTPWTTAYRVPGIEYAYTSREIHEAKCGLVLAAGRVRSKKKKYRKNPAPPKTRHEIHSCPATATNSRRSAVKHVPRVSQHSTASIDPGIVEIGLVQLSSQSVKTTNVTHTHTQTDKLNNSTLYAPRYEEVFLPKGKKRPHY